MTSLEELGHFESMSNAVKIGMTMVNVKLTPLGDISVGVRIVGLSGHLMLLLVPFMMDTTSMSSTLR